MMRSVSSIFRRGFTLLETVIAIGVLSVLLTGFILVFAPAAAGIDKAIDIQEVDRLVSTLERELVTLRPGQNRGDAVFSTGFDKAFAYIKDSHNSEFALLVYKYRGMPNGLRDDGTSEPLMGPMVSSGTASHYHPPPPPDVENPPETGVAAKDFLMQSMMRSLNEKNSFHEDLSAVDGKVYLVKCTQLVFGSHGGLETGEKGKIVNPRHPGQDLAANDYPEAVIAFTAEFYTLPGRSRDFFGGSVFKKVFDRDMKPLFTRNLAVRR
jgi:prepilin-type N-terminal cleavage/methylation domain-containing protein